MTSSSSLGSTNITLQFDLNRNIDAASRDVQAAINAARGQLPANLPSNPSFRKSNPSDAPIMLLSLTSDLIEKPRSTTSPPRCCNRRSRRSRGWGDHRRRRRPAGGAGGGQPDPAQRLRPEPGGRPHRAHQRPTANRPKGELGSVDRLWSLSTSDQLHKAAEYRPLIISYRNGAGVRLGDVAKVDDSVENLRSGGLANGKPAILLIIFRQPGANVIATSTASAPCCRSSRPRSRRRSRCRW